MESLPAPKTQAVAAFQRATSRVRARRLRDRLASAEPDIEEAERRYIALAQSGNLQMYPTGNSAGAVTPDELVAVYDQRFAKKSSPGRPIYDEILLAAPDSRCALCGHRSVASLDHHLPKRHFPALSVTPANLIPACSDCNKTKLDRRPLTRADQTIHPYFDDVNTDAWLVATVLEDQPMAVRFEAVPPASWPAHLADRCRTHFRIFGLGELYSAQAAVELSEMLQYFDDLLSVAGQVALSDHLKRIQRSCRAYRINSWRTALYDALSHSHWFVSGGFR